MSRIDDLISKFCPDGVEFSPLGTLLDYEQPSRYLVKSKSYNERFDTPVLTAGQTFILGYTDEVEGVYPASLTHPVIIFDDFTTAFKWVDFPFKAKSSAMKMLTLKANAPALFKFLYYVMQGIHYTPQDHARQWIGIYSGFRVPVPPLEVQQEIVRILDQFTLLEVELEAELKARRRQYDYYKDILLTPDNDTPWSTLGAVSSKVTSGGTPSSGRLDYYGGDIPWLRTQEVDYVNVTTTSMTITDAGLKNSSAKWIPANCVIIAMYGATAAKAAINTIPLTTNQACCNLQIDPTIADYRYVFYWVANEYERLKSKGEGSQSNLNAQKVKNYPIPVPPLKLQREIVRVLDNFDQLTRDYSVGLPAEIVARRKQYEYYRDHLLTFKETRT